MVNSRENHELLPNQFYAQGVFNVFSRFVNEFHERGAVSELKALSNGKQFQGGIVGQKPELFTERTLIGPCLSQLGYTNIVEQPADLVKDEQSVPDFKVEGAGNDCICIVESKRFGKHQRGNNDEATEELSRYLDEYALAKYKRNQDVQYLIGIATDGVNWVLSARDRETGRQENRTAHISLKEVFEKMISAKQYPESMESRWKVKERNNIQDGFVPRFVAQSVRESAIDALSDS